MSGNSCGTTEDTKAMASVLCQGIWRFNNFEELRLEVLGLHANTMTTHVLLDEISLVQEI